MKTGLEIADIFFHHLTNNGLAGAISGGIYQHQRPLNSRLEDISINTLSTPNAQVQETVVNVNIHVPNLSVAVNNTQSANQPDHVRLQVLTDLALACLTDVMFPEYYFDWQQQNLIVGEGDESYINIRVDFISFNI